MLVGGGVETLVLAGGVVAPVGVEVSVGDDGAKSQDGFGSGQAPAGAGDVEPVGDQVASGTLDRAGRDRPPVVERGVVVKLVEVAGQVAVAGVDGLAPGGRQMLPFGPGGHVVGGADGMACEDRGQMVGRPCLGLGGTGFVKGVGCCPDVLSDVDKVQQDVDRDAASAGLCCDQVELVAGAVDQDDPRP